MINASELRIGNFVLNGNGKYTKITYHEIRYAQIYPDNNYNPIPLTPEILEKSGFKKIQDSFDRAEWSKLTTGKIVSLQQDGVPGNFEAIKQPFIFKWDWLEEAKIQITHLHQLQNLYFALTNSEL